MFLLLSFDVIFHGIVGEPSDEFMEVPIVPERITPEFILNLIPTFCADFL